MFLLGESENTKYRLLPNRPKVRIDLPKKAVRDQSPTPVVFSPTQEDAKLTSDNELKVFKLAEIPAALFFKWRKVSGARDDRFWELKLSRRFLILKGYDSVTKVKFPEEKWYRLDAIVTARTLLDERWRYLWTVGRMKKVVILPRVLSRNSLNVRTNYCMGIYDVQLSYRND